MGRPKGELVWQGRSLATRAAEALWPICGSVVISVAPGVPSPAPGIPTVEDLGGEGGGPLAGIRAAFAGSESADLIVVACDYPLIDTDLLRTLVEVAEPQAELVMPTDPAGRDHPLVALWRRSAEQAIVRAVSRERRRVHDLFTELRLQRVHPDRLGEQRSRRLLNVNDPQRWFDLTGEPIEGGS